MIDGIPHTMQGTFCQLEFEGKSLFLEVHSCEYSERRLERLKQMRVLSESELGSFIELISEPIPSYTEYLYKLEIYNADKNLSSSWEFNESIENFRAIGFSGIDDLLEYCKGKWSISHNDFTTRDQTEIP